jgi:ectoine hydroxylase-related dioxygenase (phytanoyl-CoA dioxygenase family)
MKIVESFKPIAPGILDADAIAAYQRDGVVCIKEAFDTEWIEIGRRAIGAALRSRQSSYQHTSHQKKGESGKFFYDTFLWKRLPSFKKYTFDSPAAELARQVMKTQSLFLYFDMAIVKEPGTSARTPWHYDEAYWPVSGTQVCNVWMPLDSVPEETALSFVPGSHQLETDFGAIDFFTEKKKEGQPRPAPPNWHDIENGEKIVCAPVEPGDCVILNLRTHHSAPGNLQKRNRRRVICTHWLGDDARFDDKSWECSPDERGEDLIHGGPMECETFPRMPVLV